MAKKNSVHSFLARFALLALVVLPACQTASYKQTSQLAGTNWRAVDTGTDVKRSFKELQFGSKLAPSGMGQVRIAPNRIVFFQVVNEKLLMKADFLEGKVRTFDYDLEGDRLTLTSLDSSGKALGTQHFVKE